MQPITRVGYVRTMWISREHNIIQIDLPDGRTKLRPVPLHVYVGDVWGTRCSDSLNCF